MPTKKKSSRKSAKPAAKVLAENKKMKTALQKVATILRRATAKRKKAKSTTRGY
jgi:hypothetical protein